jgi:lysozyme family protein
MASIFISHSSRNNDRALEVRDWLRGNGWDDVFLDVDPQRGIVAGQRWKEALQKAAHRCQIVLALVSPEWLASGWCKSEVDAARLMGKKIIVALMGVDKGQLPPDLGDEQWVDLIGDRDGYRRLKDGLKRAGLDPASFELEPGRRPYPGFSSLEEADAAIFFGRDAQIIRGLDKIRGLARTGVDRMLVILGASGSGKSSFLRAGLWPRLARDDRSWLPLPVIRPERAAISGKFGLAQALQQTVCDERFSDEIRNRGLPRSRADIQEFLQENDDGLLRIFAALREIALGFTLPGESTAPPTIVLVIDQGEELFNEGSRDEAKHLIAILTRTLHGDPHALALLAMRSDAFPQLQAEPNLVDLPKDTFTLDMMLEGSYRAVIEGPARLVAPTPLKIDPQLTDALLEDISGQDALPLLAFTLAHLYEQYAGDNELTLTEYEKLGRLKGVINTTVTEALAEGAARGVLPKDAAAQRALARAAFIPHLAQVNPAGQIVRRVATRDTIPADAKPLIDCLADQRLLIKDRRKGEEVIEVAHEALLRQPPLSEWLAEDRDFLVWYDRLSRARTAFEANERGLLAGRELQIARDWVHRRLQSDIAQPDRTFIDQSIAEDDRVREQELRDREREQRRQVTTKYTRIAAVAGGAVAVLAILFGLYAFRLEETARQASAAAESQRKTAEEQRKIAEEQKKYADEQRSVAEQLSKDNASLLEMVQLFATSTTPPTQQARLDEYVTKLLRGRDRYEAVGKRVNVPWYVIGITHGIEAGFRFDVHLHNGDPLTARTVHVPRGRPPTGDPPFSWEDSAVDAFTFGALAESSDWSLARTLLRWEKYNGLGYRRHGINTPYLWACTNHYTSGKFVADRAFSPTAVAAFCGAAAVLKRLLDTRVIEFN